MARAAESVLNPTKDVLSAIEVGDTWTMTRRIDGDLFTKSEIREGLEEMRNSVNGVVGRAKQATDGQYVVESAVNFTRTYDLLLSVSVTRLS